MILNLLKQLKDSFPDAQKVYTEGSCFRLYLILNTIFPNCKPYYSEIDGHWITKIGNDYFDINGQLNEEYVEFKKYELVESEVILNSAKVLRYGEGGGSYNKYKKTI